VAVFSIQVPKKTQTLDKKEKNNKTNTQYNNKEQKKNSNHTEQKQRKDK
jgi:hypothetical protein